MLLLNSGHSDIQLHQIIRTYYKPLILRCEEIKTTSGLSAAYSFIHQLQAR